MLLLTILFVSGCSSDPVAPLSQFEPEIVNVADNFSFQATDLENVSVVLTYN